ncbi:LysR substrate-binding domain-containing protein [Caulobacter sp. 1776]|uniref:LysR substrate-binding domain-containing protein n=1 Tax=Caulobacter sp. 1776 TaxID=3156420 RepID=UPI0033941F59
MQQSYDLDVAEIAAFVALAEAGSFAAAAARLGRDPTIVSRRVQALEARLGVRLAERTTRQVALTEAGTAYLGRVRPLLEALEEANSEAAEIAHGDPQGRLRLSLPASFGRMWLAPLIAEFLEQHPRIRVEAEYTNRFVDLIGEGFDAAVRLGALADSRLIARKIASRRRMLCAAPSYLARAGIPASPDDLERHACLIFTGKPNPNQWEFLRPDGGQWIVPVDGPLTCDDAEALVAAGVRGLGVVYANDWLVGRQLQAGSLVPILEDWSMADEGAIYIVMPSRQGLPSKTRAFTDWLAVRLNAGAPWL